MRLWLARSAFAQPALDGGRGVGVAKGAALALAGDAPLALWNAEGVAPMRVTLSAIDVETRPAMKGGALFSGIIAPMSAQPVDMDDAAGPLALDLAGGLAAFAQPRVVFSDGAATSRILHGVKSRVLLVNLTQAPLPARIARETGENRRLDATRAFTRFFPAAGQISLPLDAQQERQADRQRRAGDGHIEQRPDRARREHCARRRRRSDHRAWARPRRRLDRARRRIALARGLGARAQSAAARGAGGRGDALFDQER